MAPPNPKRPSRPPGTQVSKDSDVELPFDDDEVAPLRADDPRPQRVPQFPAGSRRSRRQGGERDSGDRELPTRFDWSHEYSDAGYVPAFLYVERGPGVGQLVPVKQGTLVMGRASSSDLRLQHPSISRRHAQITWRAGRFFLMDLGSQNGTFLNRNRVTTETEVMPGDEISMGNAMLRLRGGGGAPLLGMSADPVTDTMPGEGRKQSMSTLGVALTAAALGSVVAAFITLIAVGLAGEDAPGNSPPPPAVRTGPSTSVTQLAPLEPRSPASDKAPAPTSAEVPPEAAAGSAGRLLFPIASGSPTGAIEEAGRPTSSGTSVSPTGAGSRAGATARPAHTDVAPVSP